MPKLTIDIDLFGQGESSKDCCEKPLRKKLAKGQRRPNIWSVEEETKMVARAQADPSDQEAIKVIIQNMHGLSVIIARRYGGSDEVLVEDLIQEGDFAVWLNISKFDVKRGYRLITYMSYWIRQAIEKARDNHYYGNAVRLPAYLINALSKINRAKKILMSQQTANPSAEQIYHILERLGQKSGHLNRLSVDNIIAILKKEEEVRVGVELQAIPRYGRSDRGSFTPNTASINPEMEVGGNEIRNSILQALENGYLTSQEKQVLEMSFGIEDDQDMLLRQIAKRMQLSRERIRQIRLKGLRKCKQSPVFRSLNK